MQKNDTQIRILFEKWYHQKATEEESREFLFLISDEVNRKSVLALMQEASDKLQGDALKPVYTAYEKEALADRILSQYPIGKEDGGAGLIVTTRSARFLKSAWFRYAALLLILFGAGLYYFVAYQDQRYRKPVAEKTGKDIRPGQPGAILTLADGKTIVLDSLDNGVVAIQNGTEISLKNGRLAYWGTDGESIGHNTLSTPKGRKFQLILPDGSKVWLNAASSIRYPTTFTGKKREVEIEGEAFFEVQDNADMPFLVRAGNAMQVEVLGTSFNINAYRDEPVISTTLLQGRIKVAPATQPGEGKLLHPGEQAILQAQKLHIKNVDGNDAIGWVKGVFELKGIDLRTALRQIGRWYDVEIKYVDDINPKLAGSAYQSDSLSDILQIIGYASDVKFTISDKTIFVTKK